MRSRLIGSAVAIAALIVAGWVIWHWERWPDTTLKPEWISMADMASTDPRAKEFDPEPIEYSARGEYLGYSKRQYVDGGAVQLDAAGLPKVKYRGTFFYNPVTMGQFILTSHAKALKGEVSSEMMLAGADKLIEMMGKDGALRYPFVYRHYATKQYLQPGWFSGMAQGVALSALARAYAISNDEKYIEAGNRALSFLQVPYPDGPSSDMRYLNKSLKRRPFYLEYPTAPNVYTLNGFMFTLLGLYDWSDVAKSTEARTLFDEGIQTLIRILPYYDVGEITSYDLSHRTMEARLPHLVPRYHSVHINQLNALYSITGEKALRDTAIRWADNSN